MSRHAGWGRGHGWRRKIYRVPADPLVALEGLFAAGFVLVFAAAVNLRMWSSLPFLYLFLQGYCYILLLSLLRPVTGPRTLQTAGSGDGLPHRS